MVRVLLVAATTGYQTRMFGEAASRLGIALALATDRCHLLDDPWRDGAITVRFQGPDWSVRNVRRALDGQRVAGILAVGDRTVGVAARLAEALGLPWHTPRGAEISRNKRLLRERQHAAGLRAPAFASLEPGADADELPDLGFPVVVKPLVLSGSRGVIRADGPDALHAAVARVRRLLAAPDVTALRDPAAGTLLVEQYVPGREYALEAVMEHGRLQVLAIFDKPDPLDGPFFEETIYVTPSRAPAAVQAALVRAVEDAARAIDLRHGPVHAECRVDGDGRDLTLLEIAARPIGGLCARSLRFTGPGGTVTLEELLLRHATGESVAAWRREREASAVMMVPIPGAGVYRGVDGVDDAQAVPGIEAVAITARRDERLVPLPEGSTYLGFVFARAERPEDAEARVRAAHARLRFRIDRLVPVAGRW